jgi:hypothetical protein
MNHKGTEDTKGLFSLILRFGNEEIRLLFLSIQPTYSYSDFSSFFLLPSSFFLLPSSFFLLPSSFLLLSINGATSRSIKESEG